MSEPLQISPAVARGRYYEELWTDDNYVAQEKLDGVRYLWHIHEGHSHITSRRVSLKTGLFVEKSSIFPHLQELGRLLPTGTILDGEVMPPLGFDRKSYSVISMTGSSEWRAINMQKELGWLRYFCFDILRWGKVDIRHARYEQRVDTLMELEYKCKLDCSMFTRVPHCWQDKKVYLDTIWAEGGEGVILKNITAPYGDSTAWVKVKPVETYDVMIVGYKPATEMTEKVDGSISISKYAAKGWIGAIAYSDRDDGYITGYCSGMDEEVRQYLSENQEANIGRMIEVRAQEKLPSGALRHPRFIRFRDDK